MLCPQVAEANAFAKVLKGTQHVGKRVLTARCFFVFVPGIGTVSALVIVIVIIWGAGRGRAGLLAVEAPR